MAEKNLDEFSTGEQEEAKWSKILDFLHYNEKDKSYKTLQLLKTSRGNIVLQITEGVAQQKRTKILFQLGEQEVAYLAIKLFKLL